MRLRRTFKMAAAVLCAISFSAIAHGQQAYPDNQLSDVMSKEDIEAKKAEDLEAKAAIERDNYEKHVKEVEQKVSAHKYNIENLEMRQKKAQDEIDELKTSIQDADNKLDGLSAQSAKLAEDTQRTTEYLDSLRQDLANRQTALHDKMVALQKQRQDAESTIYAKSVEIQRMKAEVAQTETKVQEADTVRAGLEADEMEARTAWMQAKLNISEKNHERQDSIAAVKEAKAKHDKAFSDLKAARVELAKAEKARAEVARNADTHISQYEKEILQAGKTRMLAEAEKIRLETEASKLEDYASRMKANRDQAVAEAQDAGSIVLKTKVQVETARTDLADEMQGTDQAIAKKEAADAEQRGLAGAQQAADLYQGARRWVSAKGCKGYLHPKIGGPSESYSSGSRVMAREYENPDWVEVIGSSGVPLYLQSSCGHFED